MITQDNAPTSAASAYAAYSTKLELGVTAARIVITADTINRRGAVLFDRLLACPDAESGYAVVREALDTIEAFVSSNLPVIQ
jgi:hypothetical protein